MLTTLHEHNGNEEMPPEKEILLWQKWLSHYLDRISDAAWPPKSIELQKFLRERMQEVFVEHAEALEEFLSLINDELLSKQRRQVMDTLAEGLYRLRTQTFEDFSSAENALRIQTVHRIGLTPLTSSNAVGYVVENDPGYVSIHIPPSLTVKNFIGEFRQAMVILAAHLASTPDLHRAHTILAKSLIVKDHPKIVERLGFKVSSSDPQMASISVDEFMRRWSNSKL